MVTSAASPSAPSAAAAKLVVIEKKITVPPAAVRLLESAYSNPRVMLMASAAKCPSACGGEAAFGAGFSKPAPFRRGNRRAHRKQVSGAVRSSAVDDDCVVGRIMTVYHGGGSAQRP
jgi:hypothetical protein